MKRIASLLVWVLAVSGCAHKQQPSAASEPAAAASPAASTEGQIVVQTSEVEYSSGSTPLKGFLAVPANLSATRPGVLIVHEWWGLDEYARMRAQKLAELGYVALATDMFGSGKTAQHPKDAEKFMMEMMGDQAEAKRRFEAGLALLRANPQVNPAQIAVIGYCMGGAVSLNMLRAGVELPLVATFHGILAGSTKLAPGSFKGKLLVATGGDDPFVPPAQVAAFKQEMDAAQADYELVEYPKAKHGFTNPAATERGAEFQIPLAYDAEADADSWARFTGLLKTTWN